MRKFYNNTRKNVKKKFRDEEKKVWKIHNYIYCDCFKIIKKPKKDRRKLPDIERIDPSTVNSKEDL